MAKRKPLTRHRRGRGEADRSDGQIWLYGLHTVAAALENPERHCHRIVLTGEAEENLASELARATDLNRPRPEIRARGEIDHLLPAGAVHQGAAILADSLDDVSLEDALRSVEIGAIAVLLDQASDPRNVGAVMRSAVAFDVACVIVPDRHTPEATSVLAKAASGALDKIPLVRVGNLARAMERLKEMEFWCIGLSAESEMALADTGPFDKTALVVGAEGRGLRRLTAEKCDVLARIPISSSIGSLNMSAAAAIALYELRRAR